MFFVEMVFDLFLNYLLIYFLIMVCYSDVFFINLYFKNECFGEMFFFL